MQWKYSAVSGPFPCLLSLCALIVLCASQNIGDPYKVLGIHRKATLPEIRKAYKQLAKEWHPDKNEDPNAEAKFVEIKQAYELLSDTERRQAYDLYGLTNEDEHLYKQRHDYSQYARFSNDPFEEFFGAHFRTQDQDITLFHKLSVTARHFENNILEKSVHTPALVLFYSDWCFECVRSAAAWRRLVEALQPLGVTMATVHAGHEASLTRRLGVYGVPSLTFVLDKHVYIYKEGLSSIPKILEYIRWKFPINLVQSIDDSNSEQFLSDFEDNRVKALIFEQRQTMRLRYLIAAYYFRDTVAFGFVDTSVPSSRSTVSRFGVQPALDSMVVVREESGAAAAAVSSGEIPTQPLRALLRDNQLPAVPRLASQRVLEALCPAECGAARRRLCGVLLAAAGPAARAALRPLARRAPPRVRYAYLYPHKQRPFLDALANGSGADASELQHRIVIIWRRHPNRVQYVWFNRTWPVCSLDPCPEEHEAGDPAHRDEILKYHQQLNDTRTALEQMMKRLLKSDEIMPYEVNVQELVDERAHGALGALWARGAELCARLARALRGVRAVSALSAAATAALLVAAGCLMARALRIEEETVQRQKEERRRQAGGGGGGATSRNNNETHSELRLHELRAEKYNGLVRLLKPGCRTIVVLVDAQSRVPLLSHFHKTVWPYRKNKTLVFAYLMVERNLEWFRRVLELSLGGGGGGGGVGGGGGGAGLRLNARRCVGTVLALNPHRKHFCIYHPKHPETTAANKRMSLVTRSLVGGGGGAAARDAEAGAFIGFDSSDSEREPEPLLQENLLDGLDNWLDRLFEGSTHRYYINYWPDMTTK